MMASASCAAAGVDGEPPSLPAVSLAHLLQEPDAAPPAYLRLSLTRARKARRRRRRPRKQAAGEVTLNHINAPRDYLKLSVAPSDGDEPITVAAGSLVASSSAAETTLPHKKRKLAAPVAQEETGTAASLAIVIRGDDGVTQSARTHGGDGERRSPAATTGQPIDAVPLRAAPCPHVPLAAGAAPMEPAWIRTALGLAPEHALHFIAQKRVEQSDLDAQQSRLRIPSAGVDRLLPLLSDDGRHAANLHNPKPRDRERPKPQASGNGKAQGRKHGGLVVPLVVNRAGDRMDARLTRWDSNDYTVLKYGSCQSFVRASGLKVDRIQIWAFLNPGLHLVIHKIDGGETVAAAPSASAAEQAA